MYFCRYHIILCPQIIGLLIENKSLIKDWLLQVQVFYNSVKSIMLSHHMLQWYYRTWICLVLNTWDYNKLSKVVAHIKLGYLLFQSLSYSLDFDDKLAITDYKGQEEGTICVNVSPCTDMGKPLSEDAFVDDPSELLHKSYAFKVSWKRCQSTIMSICISRLAGEER